MDKVKKIEENFNLKHIGGDYKNVHSLLLWKCCECNEVFSASTINVERSGCKNCNKKERKLFLESEKKSLDDERISKIKNEILKRNLELIRYYRDAHNALRLVLFNHNKNRFGEEYGLFEQGYYAFIDGCIDTRQNKDNIALTSKEWTEKAKIKHPEYDYSKVLYKNKNTSVTITCSKHGDFQITPSIFLKEGIKCPTCRLELEKEKRKKRNIEKLKNYLNKYNIVLLEESYHGEKEKVKIILPSGDIIERVVCNLFKGNLQLLLNANEKKKEKKNVLNNKKNIKKDKRKTNFEKFVKKAKTIHGDKYDYSKVDYINNNTKVCIICHEKDMSGEEHGEFWQTPKAHLKGYGCKKCSNNYMDKEFFIKKAKLVHGNKYDYSKVEYKNNKTPICIICPEHGEFWQKPNSHLNGRGCPLCKTSHLEKKLELFLNNNIKHIYQYRDKEIFGKQSLDFYLPDYNIAIECQGEQHFVANFFKSKGIEFAEKHLNYIQELDKKKKQLCKENNIKLIYFLDKKFVKYLEADDIYFTDVNKILEIVKEYGNEILLKELETK